MFVKLARFLILSLAGAVVAVPTAKADRGFCGAFPPEQRAALLRGEWLVMEDPAPKGEPALEGDDTDPWMIELKVKNVPAGTAVIWDVTPDDATVKYLTVKSEKALHIAGAAGDYVVKCRLVKGEDVTVFRRTVKLTGGPPRPQPKPEPGPGPGPDPVPAGTVARFFIVEDPDKAAAWRGDLFGSSLVQQFYKNNKLRHRIVSVRAQGPDGQLDEEVRGFIQLAQGKDLPYVWAYDAAGKLIREGKVPQTAAEFVTFLGGSDTPKSMGNIDPGNSRRLKWKQFGAHPNVPLIPREQWKSIDLSNFLPAVKDQDGVGACNAFATISAFEACREQAGLPYIRLSCGYLYGNINGGSDQGSLLEDGLEWMTANGTCTTATVGDLDWRKGRQRGQQATTESKNYRVVEAYECPSFDAVCSALQQGYFIIEGILWYNNFTPDRDGWLPARGSGNPGGHALCGYGIAQRNGVWGIKTRNSWGPGWGAGGNCVIPESLFGRSIGGYWAVRAVTQVPVPRTGRLTPARENAIAALAF